MEEMVGKQSDVMTMLSGTASSFLYLFVARIGVGVGEAALNPAAYSRLADMFSREKLTKAVGIFTTGAMLGTAMAYLSGGRLAGQVGANPSITLPLLGPTRPWQLAFLVAGSPGLILALLMLTVDEPMRSRTGRRDSGSLNPLFDFLRARWRLIALHFTGVGLMRQGTAISRERIRALDIVLGRYAGKSQRTYSTANRTEDAISCFEILSPTFTVSL